MGAEKPSGELTQPALVSNKPALVKETRRRPRFVGGASDRDPRSDQSSLPSAGERAASGVGAAMLVVMREALDDHLLKIAVTEDEKPVETFSADGARKALGEHVGPRGPR